MKIAKKLLILLSTAFLTTELPAVQLKDLPEKYKFRMPADANIPDQILQLFIKDSQKEQSYWYFENVDLEGKGQKDYWFLMFGSLDGRYEIYKITNKTAKLLDKGPFWGSFVDFIDLNKDKIPEMIVIMSGATGEGEILTVYKWTGFSMERISDDMGGVIEGPEDYYQDIDGDGVKEIIRVQYEGNDNRERIKKIINIYKWEGKKGYVLWKTKEIRLEKENNGGSP